MSDPSNQSAEDDLKEPIEQGNSDLRNDLPDQAMDTSGELARPADGDPQVGPASSEGEVGSPTEADNRTPDERSELHEVPVEGPSPIDLAVGQRTEILLSEPDESHTQAQKLGETLILPVEDLRDDATFIEEEPMASPAGWRSPVAPQTHPC